MDGIAYFLESGMAGLMLRWKVPNGEDEFGARGQLFPKAHLC